MAVPHADSGFDPSRRDFARRLLAAALLLPLGGCAERLPGWEGDPMDQGKRCVDRLRRMGQLSGKLGGRCG